MGTHCLLVLTLLVALEAHGFRGRNKHILKLTGMGRMAFNALSLAIRLMDVLFYILFVTGDAEISGGTLEDNIARGVHLMADLAPALQHGLMDNLFDKTRAIGTVGRMTKHTSSLHRVTSVCRYKCPGIYLMTGNAGLILPLQEQGRIVRGMAVVTRLTAFFHRSMNVGLHDGLSCMA